MENKWILSLIGLGIHILIFLFLHGAIALGSSLIKNNTVFLAHRHKVISFRLAFGGTFLLHGYIILFSLFMQYLVISIILGLGKDLPGESLYISTGFTLITLTLGYFFRWIRENLLLLGARTYLKLQGIAYKPET
ncbi:MAG: hypothetical protein ACI83D_000470 [Planctomycetota bacterium]|jgi:hypothetical protein